MAVVAPPPLHTKLDFWGPDRTAAFPVESPGPMTDIMSYQYPPPPPNGADMGMPHSGYIQNYEGLPQSSDMDMRSSQDPNMSIKDRRDSFSDSMKLKRSMSTPTVRPQLPQQQPPPPSSQHLSQQPPPDHSLGLAGDKRRNKLGYHRTSVACGHCRRRKIRCIPSPQDPQGRCVNCIRLKKECSFYPVDQQPPPPTDTRQKSSSRSSVGPKIPSASSSPAIPSGHPSEMHGQPHYPPTLAMPSIQTMAPPSMKPGGPDGFSPEAKMPSTSRAYEYSQSGMTNWMSADASPSSSKPGDLNTNWRSYAESPVTPAFSPFTPHAPPPSATWTAPASAEHPPRDDLSWSSYPPPPPRSMSFGSESMSSQQQQHHSHHSHHSHHQQPHHHQYPPISQITSGGRPPFDRKSGSMSTDVFPPPIATTIPGVESIPGTTLEHNVSLSAGAVPPPNYGSWQQSSYSSYAAKTAESYPSWYGENGSTQQPGMGSEEQHAHPTSQSVTEGTMYYPQR